MRTKAHLVNSYPPPPWRLQGQSVHLIRLVDTEVARQFVPRELRVVSVLPGKTLGALLCAHYGAGSDLEYHELIVAPALTLARRKVGLWISHIYVDEPASQAGGQEIWKLPKQLATFQWDFDAGHACVAQGPVRLCELHWRADTAALKTPIVAPAFSLSDSRSLFIKALGTGKLAWGRAIVVIGANSPFYALGFQRASRAFMTRELRLRVGPPGIGQ